MRRLVSLVAGILDRRMGVGGWRFGGGDVGGGPRRRQIHLQILGSNLVERAGSHLGVRDAQLLGLGEHYLALHAEFSGDVVDANGHRKSK
jgi:hypothetical protein